MSYNVLEANDTETFRMIYPLLLELAEGEDITCPDIDGATSRFLEAQKYGYKQFYIKGDFCIIGTIGLRPFYDPMCMKPGYIVNNFIIHKDYRGRKVAEKLLTKAKEITAAEGGNWMMGWAVKNNPKLEKWYKRLGYFVDYDLVESKF